MKTLEEKRLVFLNDTIKHFNTNNRCVKVTACRYTPIENKSDGCAIGRHLTLKLAKELDNRTLPSVSNENVFKKLPDNLKELGQSFLSDIQNLHDTEFYWYEKGVSFQGEKRVEELKNKYELN
jgi:hypothetical protein